MTLEAEGCTDELRPCQPGSCHLSKGLGAVLCSYAIIQIGCYMWLGIMGTDKHPSLHRQKKQI